MDLDDGLGELQREAVAHIGQHARLLAGPGTGKTYVLTKRVVKLAEDGVDPYDILALVFTRVNAFDLRRSIADALSELGIGIPRVSTLHSFALRQLLRNSDLITTLPQPIRIADDYEENEIIHHDLRLILGLDRRKDVEGKFIELASDWQSLATEQVEYLPADPRFLGAWQQHRQIYGYTLRSELMWQLKHAIEENPAFDLEVPAHLLVDEYQDLNRCDLDVIAKLVRQGAELFCSGDDDQSIYGFRRAHPAGIRNFPDEYEPARLLTLDICWRCDRRIIALGQYIANLDPDRLEKPSEPRPDAEDGDVHLLRFDTQEGEAVGVAALCDYLISEQGYEPDDILILLRSDFRGVYSRVLIEELQELGLEARVKADRSTPLDQEGGRYLLSLIRLHVNGADDLAWRTLLHHMRKENRIGESTVAGMYQYAVQAGLRFFQVIARLVDDPNLIERGTYVAKDSVAIRQLLARLTSDEDFAERLNDVLSQEVDEQEAESQEREGLEDAIADIKEQILQEVSALADDVIEDEGERTRVLGYVYAMAERGEVSSYAQLIDALTGPEDTDEQELAAGVINILTMHRAKGLSAKAVLIVAAEEQLIPGRAVGSQIDDERRLLFVSLTRAKHRLYITYCNQRTGSQRYTGARRGNPTRNLTPFLRGALPTENGLEYVSDLLNSEAVDVVE